jgi:hypothetical protein
MVTMDIYRTQETLGTEGNDGIQYIKRTERY